MTKNKFSITNKSDEDITIKISEEIKIVPGGEPVGFYSKPIKTKLFRVNFEVRHNSLHFITGHHEKFYYMVQADCEEKAKEKAIRKLKPECTVKSVEFEKEDNLYLIFGPDQPCEGVEDHLIEIDWISGFPMQPTFSIIDKHNEVSKGTGVIKVFNDKKA